MKSDNKQSLLAQFKAEEGSRWGFRTSRGKRQVYFKDINGENIIESLIATGERLSIHDVKKSWVSKFIDFETWTGYATDQEPIVFTIQHLLGILYREIAHYATGKYWKEFWLAHGMEIEIVAPEK